MYKLVSVGDLQFFPAVNSSEICSVLIERIPRNWFTVPDSDSFESQFSESQTALKVN